MIIDFLTYVEKRTAHQAAISAAMQAERELESVCLNHLEQVLTDLLADIEAA